MYTVHYFPDTASLVLRMVLGELGLAHDLRLVDRAAGELDTPGYRALHPLGKIPALQTPDGPMFETAAILLHLSDRHAPGLLAPAPDSPDRAAFLSWFFFTSSNIHPCLMDIFYPERVASPACIDAVTRSAADRMGTLLSALDRAAAPGPAWLAHTGPSLLGYYIAMLLRWLASLPADHPGHVQTGTYPALHRVLAQLETRPAAQSVARDESLGPLPFTAPNP